MNYRNRKLLDAIATLPCQLCGADDGTIVTPQPCVINAISWLILDAARGRKSAKCGKGRGN